jgi:ribosomal protein L18E
MRGHTKTEYSLIKLAHLNKAEAGSIIDFDTLLAQGIVTKVNKQKTIYKVVGGEELTVKGLQVRAHGFTESARAAIEGSGGTCTILSPTRNIPIEEAMADAKAIKEANLVKLKEFRALKQKRDEAKLALV